MLSLRSRHWSTEELFTGWCPSALGFNVHRLLTLPSRSLWFRRGGMREHELCDTTLNSSAISVEAHGRPSRSFAGGSDL